MNIFAIPGQLLTFLEGKKTYVAALAAFTAALAAYTNNQIDFYQFAITTLGAIGLAANRHGTATTAQKVIDAVNASQTPDTNGLY